jgi:flagellar basal-body rod protein FlgG
MIHQRRRLDTVSNNIANANTTGFRRDRVVTRTFDDELLLRLQQGNFNPRTNIGLLNHGVYAERVMTAFEQGNLQQTGSNTDMAIEGAGFFSVMTDAGEQYTRDGSFTVDSTGMLVTTEGWQLLGEGGPISVGSDDFQVDAMGNVFSGGEFIDRLRIVDFADTDALRKAGDNLFANPDPENAVIDIEAQIRQGYIEGSNVEVQREMTDMLEAFRRYESSQQVLRMMDETLGRTVNDLGRV